MKTQQNTNRFAMLLALVLLFAFGSIAFAQMETPSRYNSGSDKQQPAEEEDDYYENDQAGQADLEMEDTPAVLDKETILTTIKKRYSGIVSCYETQLQTNQDLAGKVYVDMTVQLDGSVTNVKTVKKETTLKSKKAVQCMLKIIKTLKFPERKKGEPMQFVFPFRFEPKGK